MKRWKYGSCLVTLTSSIVVVHNGYYVQIQSYWIERKV